MREYTWPMSCQGRTRAAKMIVVTTAIPAGRAKFRKMLAEEVFRHANRGPTAVRNIRNSPIGIITLSKKGGPTVILYPRIHSERMGKSVPHKTTNAAARRTRLLKRKLDSRETSDSSLFSVFRWSRFLI